MSDNFKLPCQTRKANYTRSMMRRSPVVLKTIISTSAPQESPPSPISSSPLLMPKFVSYSHALAGIQTQMVLIIVHNHHQEHLPSPSLTVPTHPQPTISTKPNKKRKNSRRIRLKNITNNTQPQRAEKAPIPDRLPTFFLLSLAGLDTEQPTARCIVMVFVMAAVVCVVCSARQGTCAA